MENMKRRKYKVLSIDGGGIRGIIPATILAAIEEETGKQIHEMFDLIVGTSTGGILALALTKPDPDSAKKLLEDYRKEGKDIFPPTFDSLIINVINDVLKKIKDKFYHTSNSLIINAIINVINYVLEKIKNFFTLHPIDHIKNLFRSKYSASGRELVLYEKFGNTLIKNALTEVFITSYDTQLRRPIFFTSNLSRQKLSNSFYNLCKGITMKDAAMATSAAPTYFPPHKIHNPDTETRKKNPYYSLIDGGVFANNPTTMGIMEAIITYNSDKDKDEEKINLSDILVISLGTGSLNRPYKYEKMKKWGLLKFVQPLINIILDGQSESVACQLDQLLPNANDKPKQYYRFQDFLKNCNDDMDDASSENIKHLEELAEKIIFDKKNSNDWHEMCEQLKQPSIKDKPCDYHRGLPSHNQSILLRRV